VSAPVTGLAASTTYHFRIQAANPGAEVRGSDETFTTLAASAPGLVTAAAAPIAQTSATLNGTVNPREQNVTDCKFEYGTTTSYGSIAPCSSLPGSGNSPVAVSAPVTGLTNKTIYHFRISATNSGGTATGPDQTFTATAPHIYKNGVIGKAAQKVRTFGWGTLKLTNSTLGEVECHTITAGYLENPTGGGSAVGKTQAFSPYECVSSSCTTMGGTGVEVTPEKLAWSSEVTEPEAGVFRMRTGNKTKTANAAFLSANCIGVKNVQFFGENAPKVLNNGVAVGALPSEDEFDQPGSGELESEGALGVGKLAGRFKIEGFGEEELLEVKNP
jgi:hypothetical protein